LSIAVYPIYNRYFSSFVDRFSPGRAKNDRQSMISVIPT
jgi:hypothetical protein